jgi:O-acetylserine/cysteine efflux transporter
MKQMNRKGMTSSLSPAHLLLAITVVVVWGFNFIMLKIGLDEIPPLTLCTIRFFCTSIPLVFFIKRPQVSWNLIILYGIFIFALQFALLFIGMNTGISVGLAALLLQLQVFFAILFDYLFRGQKINSIQLIGVLFAFTGIGMIAAHIGGECTFSAFLFIVGAALSWGIGNVLSVKFNNVNVFSLVVWGGLVALFPLFGLTLLIEGAHSFLQCAHHLTLTSLIAIAYITFASTHFGYGGWSWLLSRYPVATITPFALLAPIVAIISSAIFLDESLTFWKALAAFLVIMGVGINLVGPKIRRE